VPIIIAKRIPPPIDTNLNIRLTKEAVYIEKPGILAKQNTWLISDFLRCVNRTTTYRYYTELLQSKTIYSQFTAFFAITPTVNMVDSKVFFMSGALPATIVFAV